MAWGRRKVEKAQEKATFTHTAPAMPQDATRIGEGFVLKGDIVAEKGMRVDGTIIGQINSQALVHVGPKGRIEGNICCNTIIIEGEVCGNVEATTSITLEATGKLVGDTTTKEFTNRPGGFFEGYSHMMDSQNGSQVTTTQADERQDIVGTAEQ